MVELLSGLQWKKFDLHIHTPGSLEDRVNKSVGPTDIIARAQELQLDAICVSDHNTGSWVDKCKEAAQPTGIIVYPGVEITAQGGRRNVHILGIFDPSKGTAHVNDLLSKLNINEGKRGHTDVLAEGDVNQIINAIYAHGGIPILAHADSQCGVMKEMKGIGRIEIVRNPNLLGVHITKDDTAKFLDGSDADYGRKLATFKASDVKKWIRTFSGFGRKPRRYSQPTIKVREVHVCAPSYLSSGKSWMHLCPTSYPNS